jgi:transposase
MRPHGSAVSLERRRLRAMEFLKQGMGVREIARRLRVAAGSVSRWAKEWNAKGEAGLKSKPAPGRNRGTDAHRIQRICRRARRPKLEAGRSLCRKRRDANHLRVSAEHQQIDDHGEAPAPCTNFAWTKPISPSGNCREWNDGGLCRKRLPCAAQQTLALSVDRYCPGESYDSPNSEKDDRGRIAVANQVHERPKADTLRNGCRVTRTMPCGGCARRPSWPTEVGFGVVRPMTTNRETGSIRIMMNGFHHSPPRRSMCSRPKYCRSRQTAPARRC